MAHQPIPPELEQFLARHIQSVEQLENLSLLVQDSGRSWSVSEVLRQVQSSEESVSDCLAKFVGDGFLKSDSPGRFRFDPATPELGELARRLIATYRERRVTVIELIYRKPTNGLQSFSDAFLFKKRQ